MARPPQRDLTAGPIGRTLLLFALLAFYDVSGEAEQMLALSTMTVAVIGSFLLHGLGSGFVAERYARRAARRPAESPSKLKMTVSVWRISFCT